MNAEIFLGEIFPISCTALETLSVPVLALELSPPDSHHLSTGSETFCSSCACPSDWAKGKTSGRCWFLHNPQETHKESVCPAQQLPCLQKLWCLLLNPMWDGITIS